MSETVIKKLPDIVGDIRKTESPGRKTDTFSYAKAIYTYYEEIEQLTAEKFTMTTICKYLEGKGALPNDADVHNFRRAFRRERARREKLAMAQKKKSRKSVSKTKSPATSIPLANAEERKIAPVRKQAAKETGAGVRINPDNTFRIKPIDPDDLPDIDNLKA